MNDIHRGGFDDRDLILREHQFIGGGHAVAGVLEFPPPLVTDGLDLQLVARRGGRGPENSRPGRHGDKDQDHRRDDGPDQLRNCASVDLFRNLVLVFLADPIAEHGVKEQGEYEDQDPQVDPGHHCVYVLDHPAGIGRGVDAGLLARADAKASGQEKQGQDRREALPESNRGWDWHLLNISFLDSRLYGVSGDSEEPCTPISRSCNFLG